MEKDAAQYQAFEIANKILLFIQSLTQDPEVQRALVELIEAFKFKPLILSEVLLIILVLIYRSSRKTSSGIFARIIGELLITLGYLSAAVLIIPTIFLGTNYLFLIWKILKALPFN